MGEFLLACVEVAVVSFIPIGLICGRLETDDKTCRGIWLAVTLVGALILSIWNGYSDVQQEMKEKEQKTPSAAKTPQITLAPTPTPEETFDVGILRYDQLEDYYYPGIYDDWAEANPFTPELMYGMLVDEPDNAPDIKACYYVKGWNAFGIQFSKNPDRFYVYQDFPEDVYWKFFNNEFPYAYYYQRIRGQYGVADKYYISELKQGSGMNSGSYKSPEDAYHERVSSAVDTFGEESTAFFDWLEENEGVSEEEWYFRQEYGDDYTDMLMDEYGIDEPWLYDEFN